MDFLFFSPDNTPIFTRNDAEKAEWTVEQYHLSAVWPFDPGKIITRGMRILFYDAEEKAQVFDIQQVKNREPVGSQEITAEHIAVTELTDEHFPQTDISDLSAGDALEMVLSGTLWQVGDDTSSGTSSAEIGMGDVWQDVRTIEKNWNVYITPRVTINANGITGRYLDITPAKGVWNGLRLSINKNMDEVGVTYDDSNVKTAAYGYGRSVTPDGSEESAPLTFKNVTWQATDDHPAKPSGQAYLEDPAATTTYGRAGRARFGFYQNANISDPEILLQKTWEYLKSVSKPEVSIDCVVMDLYRLGYADEPIRLHDMAIVDVEPTGEQVQLEITRLLVDLLNSTQTRPTIGSYIPNIVYIERETNERASGGGGGGGGGQTNAEYKISEFETEIGANEYQISLRAYQRDMTNVEEILRQAGISINAQGVLVYAEDNQNMLGSKFRVNADAISSEVTNRQNADDTLSTRITQNAESITSEVTRATGAEGALSSRITQNAEAITSKVSAGDIASTINQTAQSVLIQASKINLEGYVTAQQLETEFASFDTVIGDFNVMGALEVGGAFGAGSIESESGITGSSLTLNGSTLTGSMVAGLANVIDSIGPATSSSGQISIPYTTLDGGTGSINFNIADTQYYLDGVSAAETAGKNAVSIIKGAWSGGVIQFTKSEGTPSTKTVQLSKGTESWNGDTCTFPILDGQGSTGYTCSVDASARYTAGQNSVSISGFEWTGSSDNSYNTIRADASNGSSSSLTMYMSQGSWSGGNKTVYLRTGSTSGTIRARVSVAMPAVGDATWTWSYPAQGYIQASITVGGKTYSSSHQI